VKQITTMLINEIKKQGI